MSCSSAHTKYDGEANGRTIPEHYSRSRNSPVARSQTASVYLALTGTALVGTGVTVSFAAKQSFGSLVLDGVFAVFAALTLAFLLLFMKTGKAR
jgi:hypothetical protein